MLELFIKSSDELKEHVKSLGEGGASSGESKEKGAALEKIPEEQQPLDDNEEDLVPMAMSRSISLPTATKKTPAI